MSKKARIVSVNMGYGHQRTAFPLKDLAIGGKVINANDYKGMPESDRRLWEGTRGFYEFISGFKRFPVVGEFVFSFFDRFQKISAFIPKKDMSEPTFQLKQTFSLIEKGWGKHFILQLQPWQNEKILPLVSTFFSPAFMAEHFGYQGEIFCVVCDADISRSWVSLNPKKSRIKYFAPTERVAERLKLYGVKPENIYLTGYPLPLESVKKAKNDFKERLLNLDPKKRFSRYYSPLVKKYLGTLPKKPKHPLTVMFSVGGAGAQKEIGLKIVKSLAGKIKKGEVKLILVAGIRKEVKDYFEKNIKKAALKNVEILFDTNIEAYFQKFNQALSRTDILWTKPSELSFYSALGIPIIVAPCIGSQEEFNKRWILKSGFGIQQENPDYTDQWLFDWLDKGYLAEAAMQGFIEGKRSGTVNIKKIIEK